MCGFVMSRPKGMFIVVLLVLMLNSKALADGHGLSRLLTAGSARGVSGSVLGTATTFPGMALTTAPEGSIVAKTGEASGVTPTSAVLTGVLNDGDSLASWYFQYGESRDYSSATAAEPIAGSMESQVVTSPVDIGLQPDTTYHFRLVVIEDGSPVYGQDETFTTMNAIITTDKSGPRRPASGDPNEVPPNDSSAPAGEPRATGDPGPSTAVPTGHPSFQCKVPSLISLPRQSAEHRAAAAHCMITEIGRSNRSNDGKLVVLYQAPRAGALRPQGAHIEIRLGTRRR